MHAGRVFISLTLHVVHACVVRYVLGVLLCLLHCVRVEVAIFVGDQIYQIYRLVMMEGATVVLYRHAVNRYARVTYGAFPISLNFIQGVRSKGLLGRSVNFVGGAVVTQPDSYLTVPIHDNEDKRVGVS